MEFQKILSGKEKVQILHLGFRLKRNKGPQGPNQTTYFKCVEKTCKATLATLGDLDGELSLKFHRHEQHNHRADVSKKHCQLILTWISRRSQVESWPSRETTVRRDFHKSNEFSYRDTKQTRLGNKTADFQKRNVTSHDYLNNVVVVVVVVHSLVRSLFRSHHSLVRLLPRSWDSEWLDGYFVRVFFYFRP